MDIRHMLLLLMCSLSTQVYGIDLTILESAVTKGAVCLDGTPPAYVYRKGFGDGVNNWIVFFQGGGWCISKHDCLQRSRSYLGSSKHMLPVFRANPVAFGGILNEDATHNPHFYNWNVFNILYCDGSSFMSNVEQVDPETNVTYRGARIYDAMMEELFLNKGIASAENVILAGASAGGLTTILHCDKFRDLFLSSIRVKCISDAGFFIQGKEMMGADWREERFFNLVSIHGLANSFPTSCTTKMNPILCLFPENLVNDVKTPLFLVQSAFDEWQIQNMIPNTNDWNICTKVKYGLAYCTWPEFKIMKGFRSTLIKTLKNLDSSSSRGLYVHTCYLHGQIYMSQHWNSSPLVGNSVNANKTIEQAVSDWYFNDTNFQEIDMQTDLPRICKSF
ncbi:[Wnt protein] O-palmitoleoyl-L-serine hydrolase [Salvia divinorum]|uniref:Pectin acetylesterase n=1 Tax=Salvia divinorum TaxID=28513 RepID=A0ABD1IGZ7_SALDI